MLCIVIDYIFIKLKVLVQTFWGCACEGGQNGNERRTARTMLRVIGKAAARAAAPAARSISRQQRAGFATIYDNATPYEVRAWRSKRAQNWRK